MRMQLRAGALALALLGTVGLAAAQQAPGGAGAQEKFNLSQPKEQHITQGLRSEPSQPPAGYQGQVGSRPPESLQQKPLPNDVTANVPETKSYLFIKLPDRILLIDPDSKMVAEIVGAPATTGGAPGGGPAGASPMSPSSPQR